MSDTPISHHALLSDCHSAMLVDRAGSVEWWCVPRFDSPAVFARLLDPAGGHFSLTPTTPFQVARRYEERSLVLTTTFRTAEGVLELTDALAMAPEARGHDLGHGSPGVLLRRLRCLSGEVEVSIEYQPRFEYGLTHPLLLPVEHGVIARGGPTTLLLSTSLPLQLQGAAATARRRLVAGDELCFAVQQASSWDSPPPPLSAERVSRWLDDTGETWRSWSALHQRYQGPYEELVHHSGRVLQGLTYAPTGAIVAAATTSLPEEVGGARNWDYRYTWVRDASFTLDALWVAACPDESHGFFDLLATAASSFPFRGELQVMFGVGGERDLSERSVDWLAGWRQSRPVRVGNAAWRQHQNDVYGELLSAAHGLGDQLALDDEPRRRLLVELADTATQVWKQPDHGLWESRGEPAHHVYSVLMCWVALDRAIDLAGRLEADDRADRWRQERDQIRHTLLTRGSTPTCRPSPRPSTVTNSTPPLC